MARGQKVKSRGEWEILIFTPYFQKEKDNFVVKQLQIERIHRNYFPNFQIEKGEKFCF